MATKNIEININNGSSYDVLYPKTDYNILLNKPTIPTVPDVSGFTRCENGNLKTTGGRVTISLNKISMAKLFFAQTYDDTYNVVLYAYYDSSVSYKNAGQVLAYNRNNGTSYIETQVCTFSSYQVFIDNFQSGKQSVFATSGKDVAWIVFG